MTTQHEYEITERSPSRVAVRTTISDDDGRFDVEVASVLVGGRLHAHIATASGSGLSQARVNREQALVLAQALLAFATQEDTP